MIISADINAFKSPSGTPLNRLKGPIMLRVLPLLTALTFCTTSISAQAAGIPTMPVTAGSASTHSTSTVMAAATIDATAQSNLNKPLSGLTIPAGSFVSYCFHDIRDSVDTGADYDPNAISTTRLAQFFDWLKVNDWHPVSMQQILDAQAGKSTLPANALLLSFDDGLRSMYTKAFPLLKAYGYPAIFALQTGWLREVRAGNTASYQHEHFQDASNPAPPVIATSADAPLKPAVSTTATAVPGTVLYNNMALGAEGFLTPQQIQEMQQSGLIEFASHSDDLHKGIQANPQGNMEPAAITRRYDPATQRYESDGEFHQRILNDLQRSRTELTRLTGTAPRIMVWPYGAVTPETRAIAIEAGLPYSLGLGDRTANTLAELRDTQQSPVVDRLLVMGNPSPPVLMAQAEESLDQREPTQRAVQIDLDYVYDADPAQQERNLGRLLERIKALKIRSVYLQAFADPDGDGTADALYFPNRELPMRADLFNRVSWQLRTRAGVRVYAWLPMLAYDLPNKSLQQQLAVKVMGPNGQPVPAQADYRRLSPFLPQSLAIVSHIYEDLAKQASGISGVLIHDDAYLSEQEDASACQPEAQWPGLKSSLAQCQLSPREKTQALIDFGNAAIQQMKHYINISNDFRVARNLYPRVVMEPAAEARFAQALEPFLKNYDEVALMAMPWLDDDTPDSNRWLSQLAQRVAAIPGARNKVVFELQAQDWRSKHWIEPTVLREWMRTLTREGALNFAYYPDDFYNNKPDFQPAFEGISLAEFPYEEPRK